MDNVLKDPLLAVKAVAKLKRRAKKLGISVKAGHDFQEFFALVNQVRRRNPTVFFDPALSDLEERNAMWLVGRHKGQVVHVQAFRMFVVEEGFRQFFTSLMTGLHFRRHELLKPKRFDVRETAMTRNLRGRLVYHGELWIKPGKSRLLDGPVDVLGQLGLLAAYIKWQPEAIFALVSGRSVKRGMVTRYGYPYIEKDFAVWEEVAGGIAEEEGLAVVRREDLEELISVVAD